MSLKAIRIRFKRGLDGKQYKTLLKVIRGVNEAVKGIIIYIDKI